MAGDNGSGAPDPMLVDIETFHNPYAVLTSIRDEAGGIVDFAFVAVNEAAVADYELSRETLLQSTLLGLDPLTGEADLFPDLVHVVQTGEHLLKLDYEYPAVEPGDTPAYYDISVARRGDGLGITWWDVTRRYEEGRAVAHAEREMRSIVESLLDPLNVFEAVRDATGRIIDVVFVRVNDASCRYLRLSRAALENRRLLQTTYGEAVEVIFAWCRHVLITGEPVVLDAVALVLPNGHRRQYDIRAVPLGEAVSITYRDVTDRVTAAQTIAEAKERYRLVAENASEMVFQSGTNGQIEWASPSVQWVLGWAPEQMIGRRFSDFIHPDDFAAAVAAQKQVLTAGMGQGRVEVRLVGADGQFRWMSVLGKAISDDKGRLIGGVDAVRDIQDSKDAEAALMESEQRFRRAMDDSAIGMAIVAASGRYLRVNAAMTVILERTEEQLLNCTWQELTHPDDLGDDQDLADGILRGERDSYRLDKRYVTPDGAVIWADLAVSCVRNADGEVMYYLSQIVDITESVTAREALATSEEHFRLIAENSLDVVFRASRTGRVLWISPSVKEVLGWRPAEVLGEPVLSFIWPQDIPEVASDPANTERLEFEGRVLSADGSYQWVDITSRPVFNDDEQMVGRVGRLRDIAAKKQAEEALRRSEQRFRTAMQSAPTGMAVVGRNRQFLQVNPALSDLLGRSQEWLLRHGLPDVLDPVGDGIDQALREKLLVGQAPSVTGDHEMIHASGRRVLVEQSIGLLRDSAGRPSGFVSQFADVTEARRARDQLSFLATHDSLTELLNRRELVVRVAGILAQTPRTGENTGILFIDLDGLKPINDTYGHAMGDEVIVTVARRIRDQLRGADVVARFGGDEFVVVLPAVHSIDDVERFAGLLHAAVRAPIPTTAAAIEPSVSIGAVVVPPGSDPDQAMRHADQALYQAKRQGRDQTVVFRDGGARKDAAG